MEFKEIKEHEDGSATYEVDMTKEEREFLLKYALEQLIVLGMRNDRFAKQVFERVEQQEEDQDSQIHRQSKITGE